MSHKRNLGPLSNIHTEQLIVQINDIRSLLNINEHKGTFPETSVDQIHHSSSP